MMMMMTTADELRTARECGVHPSAPGAGLDGADLEGADLEGANLEGANLEGANLRGARLQGANLVVANLRGANLEGAALRDSDLWGANLWGANLRIADLRIADLEGVNLPKGGPACRALGETPSGMAQLVATLDGWTMRVGCWTGTPDDLRTLIAQDDGWPEARGDQIEERRPFLENVLALAEWHMEQHADYIEQLVAKWR